jgi:hypothetical protein
MYYAGVAVLVSVWAEPQPGRFGGRLGHFNTSNKNSPAWRIIALGVQGHISNDPTTSLSYPLKAFRR